MGNYLTSQGYATQSSVNDRLTKEEAARLYATNADFRAQIDALIAENSRLNLQHTDFVSGSFDPLSTRVETLRTDVNGLTTNVTGLQTNTDGLITDLTALQTNYGTLNTNFNSLDSAYNGFVENDFKELSNQVGTLRTNYATLLETVNTNNNAFNTAAENLETLQGQFNTLNTNYGNHISGYNKFSADTQSNLAKEILTLENKFNNELSNYARQDYVEGLDASVQSGLSAREVNAIKAIFASNQLNDALTLLGIENPTQQQTTQQQTNPPSYLRTRNYMFY